MSAPIAPKLVKLLETSHGPMLALPHDQFVTKGIESYGAFSPGEGKLLAQLVHPGFIVVEVGANIGAHTVTMARACRPAPLFAYEPQRRVFQILCANLVLNDIDNVVARQEACGAEPGVATIPPLNYAAAGNFGAVSLGAAGTPGERVRVVRLDDADLPGCALLKIDVEGLEREVIAGAVGTISRFRPAIYVENDRVEHQRALISQIADLGYRLYWHTPPIGEPGDLKSDGAAFDRHYVSLNLLCLPNELATQTTLEPIDPLAPHAAMCFGGGPLGASKPQEGG